MSTGMKYMSVLVGLLVADIIAGGVVVATGAGPTAQALVMIAPLIIMMVFVGIVIFKDPMHKYDNASPDQRLASLFTDPFKG